MWRKVAQKGKLAQLKDLPSVALKFKTRAFPFGPREGGYSHSPLDEQYVRSSSSWQPNICSVFEVYHLAPPFADER
jgi:hypothetical protein